MFDDPTLAAAALSHLEASATVVALHLDKELRVVTANQHARTTLGAGLEGKSFADLLVDFTRPSDLDALMTNSTSSHRLTVATPQQDPETLHFRFYPVPQGILAMASPDLREQDRLRDEVLAMNRELNNLTRQLQLANAELQDLDALKNRFLAMAAHDLRQPISVVMMHADFLLAAEGSQLSAQGREYLRICMSASKTMKSLVDNFLDVSIVESGQLSLNRSATTTTQILDDVIPLVELAANRKQVKLQVDCPPEAPPLQVDLGKIRQVLTNLLVNAVQHSSAGGRVWLTVRHETNRMIFAVRDEGPGIAPAAQERLFVPFADAGTRKTAGERSIGLGLTIAHQAVVAHGGDIRVESVPGHGATFIVELPIEAAQVRG